MIRLTLLFLLPILHLSMNAAPVNIHSSGSSYSYLYYQKAFNEYSLKNNIYVEYKSSNSLEGFIDLKNKVVDFAGVDMFINDRLMKHISTKNKLLHIPTCVSGIAIVYNLPNNEKINLTADLVHNILTGQITKWNDPKIEKENPTLILPNIKIIPIYREGNSGSTYILSSFLAKASNQWKLDYGLTSQLNLPFGLKAKNSNDIVQLIEQVSGSFSYIGLSYLDQTSISSAHIKNSNGNFIKPSKKSIQESANVDLKDDTRQLITNTSATHGYPISGLSWIIIYQNQNYENRSKVKATEIKQLLTWLITKGQNNIESLGYAQLPPKTIQLSLNIIEKITYDSEKI